MTRYAIVRHRVKDYNQWKKAFDSHIGTCQEKAGLKGGEVWRDIEDPNEVSVALEFEDLDRLQDYMKSDEMKEMMQSAGVIGEPTIFFLEKLAEVHELVGSGSSRSYGSSDRGFGKSESRGGSPST